jgi:hypothetical protein
VNGREAPHRHGSAEGALVGGPRLVVRKRAEERFETVSDTVRRTEVEDERGRTGTTERPDEVWQSTFGMARGGLPAPRSRGPA